MACAILDGFAECPSSSVVSGPKAKYSVSITVRLSERIEDLSHRYPWAYVTDKNDDPKLWQFSKDNEPAAHIVLICTQPNATFQVCETIRLAHKHVAGARNLPTVVTMCPGITLSQIEGWLTSEDALRPATVIRTMPNTPVSIRQGATALVASRHATDGEVERVIEMLRIVSPCVETLAKEQLLDVAAAVSG
jgi:pyrroline-5-carboxylate reductase